MDSSRQKVKGYVQVKSDFLTELYCKKGHSLGDVNGRIECMLKYLDKELSEMPILDWAELLSFGVHGNYKGLNNLEYLAVRKNKDSYKRVSE